ncbi:10231_t:CDS:2, partial [Cetraspora pellucida]
KHVVEWERGIKRQRKDTLSISESISLLTNIIFEREILGNDPSIISFSKLKSVAEGKNNQLNFLFDKIEVGSINILTKFLYNQEKNEEESTIYNFKQMYREMVSKDFRLSSFFDSIYNTSFPKNRSNKKLDKLDKKLAIECYIICDNQNSKPTTFKKDMSLFVDLMGVSAEAIDTLSHADITILQRHLNKKKTAIADNHPHRVVSYLEIKKNNVLVLNINDYHNIHTKQIPDTCSTSSAAHITTLLLNGVDSNAIPWILSKIAKVISARKSIAFEDAFVDHKKSTYADKDNLILLTKKAQVFLLEIFALLDLVVDNKQMLLGFSSEHLLSYDKCDHCHRLLYNRTSKSSIVIACSHEYHESCFTILNGKYHYCESILKLDIKNNVTSLFSCLSKLDKSKSNLEEIVEADEDSPQDQRIENENDILEVVQKHKQVLSRMEQAYSAALEKFLNTNIVHQNDYQIDDQVR